MKYNYESIELVNKNSKKAREYRGIINKTKNILKNLIKK